MLIAVPYPEPAAQRVADFTSGRVSNETRSLFESTQKRLEQGRAQMNDRESLTKAIDALSRMVATFLVEQVASEGGGELPKS